MQSRAVVADFEQIGEWIFGDNSFDARLNRLSDTS